MSQDNPLIFAYTMNVESGFWDERSLSMIVRNMENGTMPDVIIEYGISDLVIHGDKMIFRWYKRVRPLSFDELQSRYRDLSDDEIQSVITIYEANQK